jgi:hypothetical protein
MSLNAVTLAQAAAGDLDLTFGSGGKVIALSDAGARAIALLQDGKIVVAAE